MIAPKLDTSPLPSGPTRNGRPTHVTFTPPGDRVPAVSLAMAGLLCWNEDDRVTYVSARLVELADSGAEDLLHRSWPSLFREMSGTAGHLAVGEVREAELARRNESTLPVLLIGAYGIAGVGGLMLVLDRSEHVNDRRAIELAREKISRNERRLTEAQQMANVGSWELEIASNVVTWSDQMFRMYGLDQAVTTPSYEAFQRVVHPDDREAVVRRIDDAWGRGEPVEYDYRIVRPDEGAERYMHSRNEVVHDARGNQVRLIGTVQDVTECRHAERALRESEARLLHSQKMEAVGRLAGGVAHDFNNLLTAIVGYTELAARQLDSDSPVRSDLHQIRQAGERAAGLTRQLLAFSRKQVLAPRQILFRNVVGGLGPMLRLLIGEDVVLSTALEDGDAHVYADPGQIEQVIMNLAVNARDAMPGGGILTVATRAIELEGHKARGLEVPAGRYVELLVGDTGVGMTSEVLEHLFEPFFTTKEAGKGTGLGLATVYGIVKQSGGHIDVKSEVGLGSRFRILLPQVDLSCDPASIETMDGGLRGDETVLLVEDELQVRTVTRRMLELGGYHVLEASNGMEALKVAASHSGSIDLMLTDVVMPGLNGREIADRISLERPSTRVLYMSGYTDDAAVLRAALHSGTPFVHKPFSHEGLARKVREVLDRRG